MHNRHTRVFEWFGKTAMPELVSVPAVILGGEGLLAEFVSFIARWRSPGTLTIAAPYVSPAAFRATGDWSLLDHRIISFRMVTASQSARRTIGSAVGGFPWRDLQVGVRPSLHAKIYCYRDDAGRGVCLVGSHNFSRAATDMNDEAGVMFVSLGDDDARSVVRSWERRTNDLFWQRSDVTALDGDGRPAPRAAKRKVGTR